MRQIQGVAFVTFASAVFGVGMFAFGAPLLPRWSPTAALDLAKPVLATAVGMVFFSAILLLTASRRLRRRQQQTPSPFGEFQVASGVAVDENVTDVRVLRAQIRTLEEALEQETALVREPDFTPEAIRDEAMEEVVRRIRATVRGLGVRMEDDPAAGHVLARIEAAVDRLVTSTGPFVRPTLTVARQVAMQTTAELPPFAAVPVREMAAEEADPETPILETVYAAPVLVTPVEAEVVLPIPARTRSPEIRRGRRWLRRSAA